jgi:hypothetical protein
MFRTSARDLAERLLRLGLEHLHGSSPVLIPEYPARFEARWGWHGPVLEPIAERLAAAASGYDEAIDDACGLEQWARTIPRHPLASGEPHWENDWWGTVDALVQCAALKHRNPALYIEVGSGVCTLFARRARDDFGLRTRIVSIDPCPRTDVEASCDEAIRAPVQEVVPGLAGRLAAGDILLIDGSHTALMGSDATILLLEVLPSLPPGVLVGIDDVFLPWDYPPTWTGRIYGEQYLLAAMLLGGGEGFEIVFPGWWVVECSPLAKRFEPLWPIVENRFGRHATSFWLETR